MVGFLNFFLFYLAYDNRLDLDNNQEQNSNV